MTGQGAAADGLELLAGAAEELASCALELARRFAAGATLWCAAPGAPHHARHVAVEFVHPVIVGKRSFPAVGLDGPADAVAALRPLVRPGDVLVLIGAQEEGELSRLIRRGPAWGVITLHLASGGGAGASLPPGGARADYTVCTGPADSGGCLVAYHLLWELTQVVFEHPGLLSEPPRERPVQDEECVTCSDQGRLAEVQGVRDEHLVEVLDRGQRELVDTALVGPTAPGDVLLVHAGVALAAIERGGPR